MKAKGKQNNQRIPRRRATDEYLGGMAIQPMSPPGKTWPTSSMAAIHVRLANHPLGELLAACNRESRRISIHGAMMRTINSGALAGYGISLAGVASVARQALVACQDDGYLPHPRNPLPATEDTVRRAVIDMYYHSEGVLPDEGLSPRTATAMTLRYMALHAGLHMNYRRTVPRYLAIFSQPVKAHHQIGATLGDAFAEATGVPYAEFVSIAALLYAAALENGIFTIDALAAFWTTRTTRAWCTREKVATVVDRLALSLDEQKARARGPSREVEGSPFALNSLQERPLIRFDDEHLLAPAPHYIWSRVFEGAIFDVRDGCIADTGKMHAGKRAFEALGDAVEGYVGKLLEAKYGAAAILPEQRDAEGKDGPDFTLVRDRDVALIEVKSAAPTFAIMETGDVEGLSALLKAKIAPAFRKMPTKEEDLRRDAWLLERLRGAPRSVSHVVVTLGAFPGQRLWWGGLMIPLLAAPPWKDSGPPYDIENRHHLISVQDLEDATTERAPHLLHLLNQSWVPGWRHEMTEELVRIKPVRAQRRHPYLDPIGESWRAHFRDEADRLTG